MDDDAPQLKSDRMLEIVKQTRQAEQIVDVELETVKIVVFLCGGKRYAFYGSDIREILPAGVISWVPGLPSYLPGLINLRGDIESVLDLAHFLDTPHSSPAAPMVAMAVKNGFRSGILVDEIDDVTDIPVSAINPPLATLSGAVRDLVLGEIEHQGQLINLLDLEKLAAKIAL
ncbi:chemotaxis protein CheW [Geomesophilobacter sediminis]|uniref:Chemotaxis protein CheW n=1 Tax=Geomesophilobacter sediminis TaxID=2798584 RepID=A0A8J7S9Y0_9BACT|nr:chemotaxis protein CheW [Geomesophilobacter sediminis]MBJ6727135.1 chemotaxis protein CheW [Geomesophilobacter sediminis]